MPKKPKTTFHPAEHERLTVALTEVRVAINTIDSLHNLIEDTDTPSRTKVCHLLQDARARLDKDWQKILDERKRVRDAYYRDRPAS